MADPPDLPITPLLPSILSSLEARSNLVVVAPPGAGKTTLLPIALIEAEWRGDRKIIVLEPRRLAARSAAERMASLLGERVGETVGYRTRFDTKVSRNTRIEVVTEGVFTNMLARNPGLEDVAAVLFDEFHERSLDSDLALTLCLDLQAALRDDLRLVPMSATIDGAAVANLLQAPIVESEGRAFPVELVHQPQPPHTRVEESVVAAVKMEISGDGNGDILVFLPGQREIERCYDRLNEHLGDGIHVHRLYGAVSRADQDAALKPSPDDARKVILSSAIAETSLTIEGVTCVIDSGLSRRGAYEPATGLTRLVTVRASQASVAQRAGRAGRTAPGRCIRLWHEGQTAALEPHTPPEILNTDLAPLLLDLAEWGVANPENLRWMTPPPEGALAEARKLLVDLGALTEDGQLTSHGRAMHRLPLPPRLAHMITIAAGHSRPNAYRAALLALLLQERGAGGQSIDLAHRRSNCDQTKFPRDRNIARLAHRIADPIGNRTGDDVWNDGVLLAHAFNDRIARKTGTLPDGNVRYRLANGSGTALESTDHLAAEDWLVVVDVTGKAGNARIVSAAAIGKADIVEFFADRIVQEEIATFDAASGAFSALRYQRFGAIDMAKPSPFKIDDSLALDALISAVREHGLDILPWREFDRTLLNRLRLLHERLGDSWPDLSDAVLLERLEEWVGPFLSGKRDLGSIENGSLSQGLAMLAGHPNPRELDRLAPTHFSTPAGSRIPVDYSKQGAALSVRPQELFGLDSHPSVLNGREPLEITLLSPAGRPLQTTRDLPGFWRGSWADVRSDMRGRYPKHPWPENPQTAEPTSRAKPRKR